MLKRCIIYAACACVGLSVWFLVTMTIRGIVPNPNPLLFLVVIGYFFFGFTLGFWCYFSCSTNAKLFIKGFLILGLLGRCVQFFQKGYSLLGREGIVRALEDVGGILTSFWVIAIIVRLFDWIIRKIASQFRK